MVSCSKAFWKPKNAEEGRTLIENAIQTHAVAKWWKFFLNGKTKPSNRALRLHTTENSKVQHLDTDIVRSLFNNCAKVNLHVLCEISWNNNKYAPTICCVSCVLIIKSGAVSLYLIKHCIVIKMRLIDIKSLHVMYYQQFDRSMGLWIIFWSTCTL